MLGWACAVDTRGAHLLCHRLTGSATVPRSRAAHFRRRGSSGPRGVVESISTSLSAPETPEVGLVRSRRSLEPDVSRRAGVDAARAACAAASAAPCRSWSRYGVTRRASDTAADAARDGSSTAMTAEDGLGGGGPRRSPSATVSPRCDRSSDAPVCGAVEASTGFSTLQTPDAHGARRSPAEGARTQRQWRRRRKSAHSWAAKAAHLLMLVVLATAPLRGAALKIVLPEDGRECISQSLTAELFEVRGCALLRQMSPRPLFRQAAPLCVREQAGSRSQLRVLRGGFRHD